MVELKVRWPAAECHGWRAARGKPGAGLPRQRAGPARRDQAERPARQRAAKKAEAAINDLRATDAAKKAESALSDLRQREPVKKAEEGARKVMHDLFSSGSGGSSTTGDAS